jgi:hypothetical protein
VKYALKAWRAFRYFSLVDYALMALMIYMVWS